MRILTLNKGQKEIVTCKRRKRRMNTKRKGSRKIWGFWEMEPRIVLPDEDTFNLNVWIYNLNRRSDSHIKSKTSDP